MAKLVWHENVLMIGRLYVGMVDRNVPEGWREEYANLPEVAGPDDRFATQWRIAERNRYREDEQAGKIWGATIVTSSDGDDVAVGFYATEKDAMLGLEAAVRAELDK